MFYLAIDQHAKQITVNLRKRIRNGDAPPPGLDAT